MEILYVLVAFSVGFILILGIRLYNSRTRVARSRTITIEIPSIIGAWLAANWARIACTVALGLFIRYAFFGQSWWPSPSLPQVVCPNISSKQTRSCQVNTSGSKCVRPAEGVLNNGMIPCYYPMDLVEGSATVIDGTSCYSFRAKSGLETVFYGFVSSKAKCPADLPPHE